MNLELLESRGRGEPPCSADVHNFECSTVRTSYHAADRLSVMYIQSKKDVGQGHACQVGTGSQQTLVYLGRKHRAKIDIPDFTSTSMLPREIVCIIQ